MHEFRIPRLTFPNVYFLRLDCFYPDGLYWMPRSGRSLCLIDKYIKLKYKEKSLLRRKYLVIIFKNLLGQFSWCN
jgi:hypothetical protein